MAKRKTEISLPKGVERKRVKGRIYYYWTPHRGTDREGKRIPLPPIETAAFWRELERLQQTDTVFPNGSVGDLVQQYRDSPEFDGLSLSTKTSYNIQLNRFVDNWGPYGVSEVTPIAVMAVRNVLKDTPGMANQMLSVGRTLYAWALPLGLVETNPFVSVEPIVMPDKGHVPWPKFVVEYVLENAPPDLVRLTRLGIMTCQRESDLVRMGPDHRDKNYIWCRPQKTKRKRKAFGIPLAITDALELDRWSETPMMFKASRWKSPIARQRDDLYLYSPKGAAYNPSSLRQRWRRWLDRTDEGRELRRRWKEWIAGQIKKYEWEIDPEDATHPTIHGLRGTGILERRKLDHDVEQIANDIGMSRKMVEHYMRFKDQMEVAAAGQARLKLVTE
jgi:integrase